MVAGAPASLRTTSSVYLLLILALFLYSLVTGLALQVKTLNFGNPFNSSYVTSFAVLGDASVNGGALQLTPDTRNNRPFLVNKAGRVILPERFKLWEGTPSNTSTNASNGEIRVASFNTTFDINIFRDPNDTPGEGVAFAIFPHTSGPPPNGYGGYLGLTNATLDGLPSNRLIAVELDTVKQSYDPDDNHVGLNLNSVRSNVTSSLTKFGIVISPANATNYTVWIDYDGPSRFMNVFMALQGSPKPRNSVLNSSLDLSHHASQYSYFGFAGSTGTTFELNCVLSWNLTVDIFPDEGDNDWKAVDWVLRVGIPILAAILILVVAILFYTHKKRVRDDKHLLGTLKSLPGMPREFRYRDLKKATNNFDAKNKLGQGGFGIVYKGLLPKDEIEVAVKKFSRDTMQVDFLAELTIINRLRHKHLVRLLGWCHENGMLLLVYEFMPNGSLDHHLYSKLTEKPLSWERRYTILEGVVSALHYLHNEYDQKVVHRDLKASNIMLDSDFNARLGDFGLARAIDNGCTSYAEIELEGVPGTFGYIAPECFHTGKATRESDVFGFGAVVLEVVCGRRPRWDVAGFRFLADWVWKLHREGRLLVAVDDRLDGAYVAEDAERLLLLGLACSHSIPAQRPTTQAIVQVISRSVPPPTVPPFRPAFVWPVGFPTAVDGDTSSMANSVTSFFYASTNDGGWTPQHLLSKGSDVAPVTGGTV